MLGLLDALGCGSWRPWLPPGRGPGRVAWAQRAGTIGWALWPSWVAGGPGPGTGDRPGRADRGVRFGEGADRARSSAGSAGTRCWRFRQLGRVRRRVRVRATPAAHRGRSHRGALAGVGPAAAPAAASPPIPVQANGTGATKAFLAHATWPLLPTTARRQGRMFGLRGQSERTASIELRTPQPPRPPGAASLSRMRRRFWSVRVRMTGGKSTRQDVDDRSKLQPPLVHRASVFPVGQLLSVA
jgi:hypothetical protein